MEKNRDVSLQLDGKSKKKNKAAKSAADGDGTDESSTSGAKDKCSVM